MGWDNQTSQCVLWQVEVDHALLVELDPVSAWIGKD